MAEHKVNIVPLVKVVVLNAALSYELHDRKGEQWRRVFKESINKLKVKSGKRYRFLVKMAEQPRESMDRVVDILTLS